jgi:hypothetical protein
VYLNENNKLKNLYKGLRRCKKIRCSLCKERGGGLGCVIKNCYNSYHYLCAKLEKSLFINSKFIIYCKDHKEKADKKYLMEEDDSEEENLA